MRTFIIAATALALTARTAPAQDVTLLVHHFLGPNATTHRELLEPWAERIESQSGGRIEIEIFPSMAMGGKPPELYGQVRDGFADVVWTLAGYTPGVFPRAEVFELPTVHKGSAVATNLAIQDVRPMIEADFQDVHPLLIHVHAGNAIHLVDDRVEQVADLRGLKLRTPSRTGAWLIEGWGAEPVGMPAPDLPQALSKGVVDGALIPFEVMPPLKLHEMTRFSVEGPEGERFGTSVFLMLMNKDRYEALPDDLKAVIDANSGAALAEEAGRMFMRGEELGESAQRDSGGEIVTLSSQAMAEFRARGEQVVERWVEETSAQGVDARALVDAAREAVETHSDGGS